MPLDQKQVHDPATTRQAQEAEKAVEFVEALVEPDYKLIKAVVAAGIQDGMPPPGGPVFLEHQPPPILKTPRGVFLEWEDASNLYKILRASAGAVKFGKKGRDSFIKLKNLVTLDVAPK